MTVEPRDPATDLAAKPAALVSSDSSDSSDSSKAADTSRDAETPEPPSQPSTPQERVSATKTALVLISVLLAMFLVGLDKTIISTVR
jgi:hypothetical protein